MLTIHALKRASRSATIVELGNIRKDLIRNKVRIPKSEWLLAVSRSLAHSGDTGGAWAALGEVEGEKVDAAAVFPVLGELSRRGDVLGSSVVLKEAKERWGIDADAKMAESCVRACVFAKDSVSAVAWARGRGPVAIALAAEACVQVGDVDGALWALGETSESSELMVDDVREVPSGKSVMGRVERAVLSAFARRGEVDRVEELLRSKEGWSRMGMVSEALSSVGALELAERVLGMENRRRRGRAAVSLACGWIGKGEVEKGRELLHSEDFESIREAMGRGEEWWEDAVVEVEDVDRFVDGVVLLNAFGWGNGAKVRERMAREFVRGRVGVGIARKIVGKDGKAWAASIGEMPEDDVTEERLDDVAMMAQMSGSWAKLCSGLWEEREEILFGEGGVNNHSILCGAADRKGEGGVNNNSSSLILPPKNNHSILCGAADRKGEGMEAVWSFVCRRAGKNRDVARVQYALQEAIRRENRRFRRKGRWRMARAVAYACSNLSGPPSKRILAASGPFAPTESDWIAEATSIASSEGPAATVRCLQAIHDLCGPAAEKRALPIVAASLAATHPIAALALHPPSAAPRALYTRLESSQIHAILDAVLQHTIPPTPQLAAATAFALAPTPSLAPPPTKAAIHSFLERYRALHQAIPTLQAAALDLPPDPWEV